MEEWKKIDIGDYEISNHGRVRSLKSFGGYSKNNPRILKTADNGTGRKLVNLSLYTGKQKVYKVHRLVGQYFVPNPLNRTELNHIDGNCKNNHHTNLEWCTRTENLQHAWDIGLNTGRRGKHYS